MQTKRTEAATMEPDEHLRPDDFGQHQRDEKNRSWLEPFHFDTRHFSITFPSSSHRNKQTNQETNEFTL